MRCIAGTLFVMLSVLWGAAALGKPEAQSTGTPPDAIMGEFEGTFTPQGGQAVKAMAKVLADQEHAYRIVILYPYGQGHEARIQAPAVIEALELFDPPIGRVVARRIELAGKGQGDEVALTGADWKGAALPVNWSGKITKDALSIAGQGEGGGQAEMKRVVRSSPTLGEKPPAGAVVLLPFAEGTPTNLDQWAANNWIVRPDGSVQVGRGDIRSRKDFGSFKAHVEFCVPWMPAARGQGRGNSGVYLHGRYEIQVLDSFGLTPNPGECAAIYGQKPPSVNVSLPPECWQTYDIEFKAPKFDASGKQIAGALITVLHNGVKVQDAVETKNVTGGAWGKPAKTGPLRLQDHHNPTRFRNIWVVEM